MKPTDRLILTPSFRRLLIGLAALNGIIGIMRILESFEAPTVYRKDFLSPYLMAKAILNGVNPYLPLHELAGLLMGNAAYSEFTHPTPHTPIVGMLMLPLALLGYRGAALVWFGIELICQVGSILLLARWWGKPLRASRAALCLGVALGWTPVVEDCWFGQFTTLLLLMTIGAWLALRDGKDTVGGALLGGLMAIKLAGWPVVIFLALRGRWRAVIAALGVAAAANLLSAAVLGFDRVWEYYLTIGPMVSAIYKTNDVNYSAWTWGVRLFAGFGKNFLAPPLWPSASLAGVLSLLAPVVVLALGLRMALRAERFDTAFAAMVIIGLFVNPIAWTHYLMLTTIPIAVIARKLALDGLPRKLCYLTFGLWLPLSLAGLAYSRVVQFLGTESTAQAVPVVPFAAGLITLIPAAALLCLLGLLRRLDTPDWTDRLRDEHQAPRPFAQAM
jgi:hypothetical protein